MMLPRSRRDSFWSERAREGFRAALAFTLWTIVCNLVAGGTGSLANLVFAGAVIGGAVFLSADGKVLILP